MTILSSTRTGKSGIKVNDKMLNDLGYILKSTNFSYFYGREFKTFVKNNKKRINSIKNIKDDSLKYVIIINTKESFIKYQIKSINDLILVDKFLFSKDSKKYKKYKKEIMKKLQKI